MQPVAPGGRRLISAVRGNGFLVGDELVAPALLITVANALSLGPLDFDTLAPDAVPALAGIDLLLLGTGAILKRAPAAFAAGMRERGIRVEPMDSRAAARTYNVLATEDRPVAALIL